MKRLISEVNAPAASECLCRGHPLHLLLLLVPLQLHDLLPAEHKLHICVALPHEPRGNFVVSLDVHRNLSGATPDTRASGASQRAHTPRPDHLSRWLASRLTVGAHFFYGARRLGVSEVADAC